MKAAKKAKPKKKLFTPAQANAMLPLLRSILRDVSQLAHEMQDCQDRAECCAGSGEMTREQREVMEDEFEGYRGKMHEYLQELENLGIELKDPFAGLIDFRALVDGREVYLCWRMDEPEVAHWHELDSGFTGRQKLMVEAETN